VKRNTPIVSGWRFTSRYSQCRGWWSGFNDWHYVKIKRIAAGKSPSFADVHVHLEAIPLLLTSMSTKEGDYHEVDFGVRSSITSYVIH
jgi:hypothetical protein